MVARAGPARAGRRRAHLPHLARAAARAGARRRARSSLEAPAQRRGWIHDRFGRLLEASAAQVIGRLVELVELRRRRTAAGTVAERSALHAHDRAAAGAGAAAPEPARDANGPARQPQADLRAVRHRRLQPARPRRRADRRRDARAGLQPAVHLRASRASARPTCSARSRTCCSPTARPHASAARPARPSPTSSSARSATASTEAFKARFRDVDVLLIDDVQFLERKATHRGGVLPHLQRAARRRAPDRAHLRPPAARPAGARGPPARALRGRPRRRHPAARPRHAPGDPAQARPPRRRRARRRAAL